MRKLFGLKNKKTQTSVKGVKALLLLKLRNLLYIFIYRPTCITQ